MLPALRVACNGTTRDIIQILNHFLTWKPVQKQVVSNVIFGKYIASRNMPLYSENQVRLLYEEFRGLKKYAGKLVFFDRHFGIIPFSFPDFDPQLPFFFQKNKTDELAEIFKKERNNPALTEKKFSFGETFVFSIRPANSNSAVYNNYILSCFLSRTPVCTEWIRQKMKAGNPVEVLLDEANGIINHLEYCLQHEYDKSFRLQCMSVFYKGFYDAFKNRVNGPGKKRKFTELYLYAQGIIYANYISSLKAGFQSPLNPDDLQRPAHLDLPGKLDLLNELGIIEFLKTRYAGMDSLSFENKLAEILCLITGEYAEKKESLLKILSSMNRHNAGGSAKGPATGAHRKILRLTTGK